MRVRFDGSNEWFELTKIAGRGELGDINWSANFDRPYEVILEEYEKLKKHIGEPVVLSGGGGWVWHVGILKGVELDEFNGKKVVRAHLEKLDIPIGGRDKVDPLIDSWQISVFDKPDKVREELKKLS